MSFRKKNKSSNETNGKSKSFSLFSKLFMRYSVPSSQIKNHPVPSNQENDKEQNKYQCLRDLELDLVYMSRLMQQKIDLNNSANILLQIKHCLSLLETRLTECQSFLDFTEVESGSGSKLDSVYETFELYLVKLKHWSQSITKNLSDNDRIIGQQLFVRMEFEARDFIGRVLANQTPTQKMEQPFRRTSLDNRSFHSVGSKSRFTEDDLKLIDRLKQLENDVDIAPKKPSLPPTMTNGDGIDKYLSKIEELARAQVLMKCHRQLSTDSTAQYTYLDLEDVHQHNSSSTFSGKDNRSRLVKIVDNCIMAASMISNEIPQVDDDDEQDCQSTDPSNSEDNFSEDSLSLEQHQLSTESADSLTEKNSSGKSSTHKHPKHRKHSAAPIAPVITNFQEDCDDDLEEELSQHNNNKHPTQDNNFLVSNSLDRSTAIDFIRPIGVRRSRDIPLPPVPYEYNKRNSLPRQLSNSNQISNQAAFNIFPSEQRWEQKSKPTVIVDNRTAKSISESPIRSAGFINNIHFRKFQNPSSKLNSRRPSNLRSSTSTESSGCSSLNQSLFSCNSNSLHKCLVLARQIPSVVSDPNHLLNINDMKNDVELLTSHQHHLNHSTRSSNCEVQSPQQPSSNRDIVAQNNQHNISGVDSNNDGDDMQCDSEVKSDTEEYYEYFEIDGRKYRRKMQKRTIIEKIKIRKTILAPMKLDGSGPDLKGLEDIDNDDIDEEEMDVASEYTNTTGEPVASAGVRSRNMHNNNNRQMRISRFVLFPESNPAELESEPLSAVAVRKRSSTLGNESQQEQQQPLPILATYMYKFGQGEVDKDPILLSREKLSANHRYSQFVDNVILSNHNLSEGASTGHASAAWITTAESSLPHERSKSICYLKKYKEQNDQGNTVHGAVRVTSSRTIRMKPDSKVFNQEECESSMKSQIPTKAILDRSIEDESDVEEVENEEIDKISSKLDFDNSNVENYDADKSPVKITRASNHEIDIDSMNNTFQTVEDITPKFNQLLLPSSINNNRASSIDSCFYSARLSSYFSEPKDQISFILKESNPSQYLIFDLEAKEGECEIAGGPIDALIVYACDVTDHLFLGAFLETYRAFIDPTDLIHRLIIRYCHYRSLSDQQLKQQSTVTATDNRDSGIEPNHQGSSPTNTRSSNVKFRNKKSNSDEPGRRCNHVLSLFLAVIGKLKRDFVEPIQTQVAKFQEYLLEINEKTWNQAITTAITTLRKRVEEDNGYVQRIEKLSHNPPDVLLQESLLFQNKDIYGHPNQKFSYKALLQFNSSEIAEQMTILAWTRYRDVELNDLLNRTDIDRCQLPGVTEYARHFDNIELWTEFQILNTDKRSIHERDKVCAKFLNIMKHLRKLNNFNTLAAILLAVLDLDGKKLFSKKVSAKINAWLNYLQPPRFFGYRQDLLEAGAPCIPFLGLFYQELTFLNLANPAHLDLQRLLNRLQASNNNNSNNLSDSRLSSNTAQLPGSRCTSNVLDNLNLLANLSAEQCGPIINFWRAFKQYVFLKNCNKDQDNIRYSIEPNEKLLRYINNYLHHPTKLKIIEIVKEIHH